MITVSDVSLQFGGQTLFKNVDLLFTEGNCYGVIGANGAGKSTFLKILNGELEPTTGTVTIPKNLRMSVLRQDHFAFDEYTVQETVIMGNKRLYDVMKEKDALYEKEDFSEEDGNRASELEGEFAELGGWEAESDAAKLVQGLGLDESIMYSNMSSLSGNEKVKVLLAQALFGNPDIILMDEPTNHLDIDAIAWLEDFLAEYFGTVIVVSHDRHFLNNVCTHTVDIDYGKIKMYVGNYEFWYESSQLIQRMIKQQNKKNEEKIKELQTFIQRFSANKSKSKQATSRRKLLDKLTVEEMPASKRAKVASSKSGIRSLRFFESHNRFGQNKPSKKFDLDKYTSVSFLLKMITGDKLSVKRSFQQYGITMRQKQSSFKNRNAVFR